MCSYCHYEDSQQTLWKCIFDYRCIIKTRVCGVLWSPAVFCQTTGCHCSTGCLLRAASGQQHSCDVSPQTLQASLHPDTLWKCSFEWLRPTPCWSYLDTNTHKHVVIHFQPHWCIPSIRSFEICCWCSKCISRAAGFSSVSVAKLTLSEVDIISGPGVAMLSSEDANRVRVGLWWGAADPVQLNTELISCQRRPITVVDIQHKELIPT